MKVKVLLAILFLVLAGRIQAQTTLATGDIIFTGYTGIPASGTPDTFKFVLLTPISSGTTIYFTERGYQGGSTWQASGTTEGTISWVSGTALAIGTEVMINGLGSSAATVNGVANGTVATVLGGNITSGLSLSNAGDQIMAFQGGAGDPTSGAVTFIAGISWALSCGTTSDATWNGAGCSYGPQSSTIPPGLTGGTSAFLAGNAGATPNNDHGRFNCTGTPYSTVSALRSAIMNKANWVFSNTGLTVYSMQASCTYYATCSNPTISTNPSNSTACATGNTSFSISASGATAYQWQVNNGGGFTNVTNVAPYSGATTATLTITGVTTGLNGYLYRCIASNGGCSSTSTSATLTVSNPVLTANSQTNVACFGGNNGAASVNAASGGVSPYTYNWTPGNPSGDGTVSVTGLIAGVWTCTTTDNIGCTATRTFNITSPTAISVTAASQTNVACFGGSNGAASINTPTGGAGGFTYNWTPGNPTGDGTVSVTGLIAGSWTCTVTDANSCTATRTFTITQPPAISVTAASQTNVSCNGGNNGAASINTPTGGAGGYTYNWTPGNPTGDGTVSVTGLTAGTWTCTVTDANACTASQTFNVTQPTPITVTPASQTNVACFGGITGAASINTPTGGAGGYTYNWTPGNPTGDGTVSVTGLVAGSWTCTVTDANACTASQTFNITQPTAITVTPASQTNVACFGGSTGAASINTPTGGAGGFTYNWTPGNPTGDGTVSVTGLTAGSWTCTVTDANSCTASQTFNITSPTALVVTPVSQTNVACFGGSTGAASVSVSGGTTTYSYNWTPGNPTGDGTASVTGLVAGTWTCNVTDANSCTTSQTFNITSPTALVLTPASQTNVACFGGSNGAASINTPTGGAGGFTYNWTPGNPTGDGTVSVTGLIAGVWTCTVTDANSCTATQTFNITQPTAISVTPASQTNVACNGGSTGAASINTPTGGAGGFTYNWTPGNPTGDGTISVIGLTAGSWTCTVTDANSCTATATFNITQPAALSASISSTPSACNASSGTATVSGVTGGVGGYTYSWAPSGGTNPTATGLATGSYTCTITDANGCQITRNVTVAGTTPPSLTSAAQTNVSCFGGSNGSATVNAATGGTGGYTYNWTPGNPTGDGTVSVTGLTAGTWTCTVTDANGCTAAQTFTITQPSAITVTPASQTNVACFGGSNGAASINTPTGGAGGYTYNWTPGNPTGDGTVSVTGLVAGSWTCTVTDANACTASQTFNITSPTALVVTPASQTNVSCFGGSNGAASINTPTGGAGGYTYNWTPGNPSGDGTVSVTGLIAGVWTCTVTDANSCTASQTFNITQPTAITVTPASQTNVACFGGSTGAASINTPTGGAGGFTYNWTPGNPTGDGTVSVTGLTAGSWTCTVTDANGCTASQTFNITSPTAINVSAASQTNASCAATSDGAASINTPTGGAGGFTYDWTPGNPTGDGTTSITGLAAGTWICTVTDVNSCTATVTFNIINASTLSLTAASQTNVSCFGGSNGAASVNTATGGAGGYTYNWTPGNPTGDGTVSVTGLTAGTWTCTVTDANGCTASQTFNVASPTALVVTPASQTNVSCFGGSNGAASINVPTGGAGGYTYNWTPGNPTGDGTVSVTGLTAGTWTCTVTDANACTASQTFNITSPTALVVTPASQTNVSCFGGSNGAASINVPTGGAGGYTYNWTPGNPTGDGTVSVTGLTAGTWTCTVTDANGCTASQTFNITSPTALVVTPASQTNVSCFGGSNGAASINTPTGGAGGYTYNWTPGNPTGDGTVSVTGLTAGGWTCTVTDANACTASQTFNITSPTALVITPASQTNVSCFGGSNGAASVNTATGGAGGYTYNWTPGNPTGDGTVSVTGLTAGGWTCTVTDANSCTATQTFNITSPTALVVTPASQTNVSCFGGSNGAASINIPTGGAGGYTYNWTPGNPTGDGTVSVTGLTAGTWTCTVTDANACTASQTFNITSPTALVVTPASQTNVSCFGGSNGAASINVPTGGAGGYTYNWTPGNPTGDGTVSVTGLTAGTWSCTVTDANACTASQTFNITSPTALVVTIPTQTNVSCNGGSNGSLTASVTGGVTTYTYEWSGTPTGDGTATITGLAAGAYDVVVTDANSCTASASATITEPAVLSAFSSGNNVLCNGGTTTVTVTATGGTGPYTGDGTFTVSAGTYNYTVTDANGCTATTSITITEPAVLTASASGNNVLCNGGTTTVTVTAAGGTAPYTGEGTFTVSAGTYNYTVTDANGCSATTSITISEPTVLAASSSSGNILCNGGTTTVTVSATGGTGPYTGDGTFTVSAGTYNYTVTDANGCTATTSITVSEPATLAASSTGNNVLCNGGTTTVTVTATGGTAPYTGEGTFTVGAGTYTYTVTDANGCSATTSITITEPATLVASSAGNNVLCNGGTTTVTVTATGGTAPYTGEGTFTVSAGTYSYTVTDANGCTATTSITITEPATLAASSAGDNVLCNGGTTTVTVTATGGTAPYTGDGTFTVSAGTYNYTVTDANGCTATTSITVSEPATLAASSTGSNVLCNGGTTTVTVTATGGTAPYTGEGTFTVSAGTYTYTVTDANGCTATTSITITEPATLVASSTGDNVLCNGGTTTVTVTATGGTAPYTGEGTFTVSAGTYTYTVTDANGCTATTSITVTEPATLAASSTGDNVLCNGGTTTVTVTATGGTAPYTGDGIFTVSAGTYTYTVTDANGCTATTTITVTEPATLSASSTGDNVLCNGGTTTVTVTATGGTAPYTGEGTFTVSAGTYTYTVTDANGCTATTTITITEPAALVASSAGNNVLCNGGTTTVTVNATGGTAPYTGEGTFTVSASTYTYTVTDANGCTATTTITITEPAALVANQSVTPIPCNGGAATVVITASGGTAPYLGEDTYTETPGTYTYTVTDDNGCTASTTVTITEPDVLSVAASGNDVLCNGGTTTVTVTATGGTAPYTGDGTFTVSAGTYTYTVTDANGCTATTSITINEPTALVASSSSGSVLCNGGTTTVTVTATGGTGPYTGEGTFTVSAGTYTYTVTDANGCTATTTITVTEPALLVANASATAIICNGGTATVTVTASGGTAPYTGEGTFTEGAGTYSYTVTDANGCTATTQLTVTEPAVLTTQLTTTVCAGESVTVGTSTYNTTGVYTNVLQSVDGCDSTVVLDLTVLPEFLATENVTSCSGTYTYNGQPYTQSGTYTVVLTSQQGCDSTITLNLVIQLPAATTVSASVCYDSTYNFNGTILSAAGTYYDTLTTAAGCDSVVILNLTVSPQLTRQETGVICGTIGYVFYGQVYTTPGVYTHIANSLNACDTVVTLTLTQQTIDANATISGTTCTAAQQGATYQWYNCTTNQPIPGATSQNYTATQSGSYNCLVTIGDCSVATNCVHITISGVEEVSNFSYRLYPNPNNGMFTIQHDYTGETEVVIENMLGQRLKQFNMTSTTDNFDISDFAFGVYNVVISNKGERLAVVKVVKQ
jgi:hypothetical protein